MLQHARLTDCRVGRLAGPRHVVCTSVCAGGEGLAYRAMQTRNPILAQHSSFARMCSFI